jgi:hypothetical protein
MNESSFKDLWEEKDGVEEINYHKQDRTDIIINENNQNFCFYNFTRNPANYLKLNICENDYPENYQKDFNTSNLIYNRREDNQNNNLIVENLNIIEEKENLEFSQKSSNKFENYGENFEKKNSTHHKFMSKNDAIQSQQTQIQENHFNEEIKFNENYSDSNSQLFEVSEFNSQNTLNKIGNFKFITIPENFEKLQEINQINNNSQFIKINNKLNLNSKMWRSSENYNDDYNGTQNFGNFQYIPEVSENNNLNYEDFNNIEDMNYNYSNSHQFMDENENPNNFNGPVVLTSNSESSLQDRFQVFSMKNRNSIKSRNDPITHISKENISNNIQSINGIDNNFKNINQVPHTATKKVITKEFFSQQLKSLGNLNTQSVKNADLVSLENKFGMTSQNLECPYYESYSEENLREEMKKYGMKPASTKFMVKQLKEIWNFLNLSKK